MNSFLILGIITYLIGVFFKLHLLYKLAYFFLGLYIMIRLYHNYIINNLLVYHILKEVNIFYNEQINCEVKAVNKGRLPVFWLKIGEQIPRNLSPEEKKDVVYLKPGEEKSWKFSLKGRRRGFYQLGPLEWETGDIFGFNRYIQQEEKLSFFVFPRILGLEELGLPSRIPYGNLKWAQPIYKDPYQFIGVREYQSVDSLRKIHWKATARTGKLQVKENQSTVSPETALFLNLSQEDYGLKYLERKTEFAITVTASIAVYFNQIGLPFGFTTNGENPYQKEKSGIYSHPIGGGELHLQKILKTLACIEITEKENFLELLANQFQLSWGGTIIIITEEDTEELLQLCNNLISRGYSIKLLLLGERVKHLQYLHRPLTAPLSICQLHREEDINGLSRL